MLDKDLILKTKDAISIFKNKNNEYYEAYMDSSRYERVAIRDYLYNNMPLLSQDEKRKMFFELYSNIDNMPSDKIPSFLLDVHNEKIKNKKIYDDYNENVYNVEVNKILCNLVYDIIPENSKRRSIDSSRGTRDIMNDLNENNFIILNTYNWGHIIIIKNYYSFMSYCGCTITDIKNQNCYECRISILSYIEKETNRLFENINNKYGQRYVANHKDEIPELNTTIPFERVYPIKAQTKNDTYGRTRNYLAIGFIPPKYRYFL